MAGIGGYDSIMTAIGKPKERRQLQIGDRLSNGDIWLGDSKINGLVRRKEELLRQAEVIKAEIVQVETELDQVQKEIASFRGEAQTMAKPGAELVEAADEEGDASQDEPQAVTKPRTRRGK